MTDEILTRRLLEKEPPRAYNEFKASVYDVTRERATKLKNTGFDYKGQIFRRTMSPLIFADPVRASILDEMEKIVYTLIQKIKYIQNFRNFTEEKDSTWLKD